MPSCAIAPAVAAARAALTGLWLLGASCVTSAPPPPAPASAPAAAEAEPDSRPAPQGAAEGEAPSAAQDPTAEQSAPESEEEAEAEGLTEAQAAPASGQPAEPAPAPHSPFSGYVSLRYRPRFTGDEHDHDAYAVASVDYADAERPWFSAHVLGRLEADLDGDEEPSVFGSLADTYDSSLVAHLYHAYVAIDRPDWPVALRAGRMVDTETPEVLHLDGVAVTSRPRGDEQIELELYAGIPVHLYESSSEGDSAFGTALEARPWKHTRVRFDWMHLEDELLLGDEQDDLIGLALWQGIAQRGLLEARYTRLEGDNRDLLLRGQYGDAEGKTIARANYYELLEPQKQQTTDLDPFTEQLLEYFPFRQAGVIVSRMLTEHTTVDLGFDLRRVTEEEDITQFNRDWERYYATAVLADVFRPGLSLALTGEVWDGDDQDIDTWGADVSFEPDDRWEVGFGSYFSLYKYDLFTESERDDVRTYFVRGVRRWSKDLSFDAAYEFEDDDFEQYHVLRLGGTWSF